jgi:hypothetical protein
VTNRIFSGIAVTVFVVFMLSGCAALPLAALGGAALESGAGAVVKTGTEYTMGGTAYRTFTIPQNAVRAAVLEAFDRAGVTVKDEKQKDDEARITGQLHKRTVRVRLTPLSPSLTVLTLIVKRNVLVKDRATTSELLEQVEQVLSENPSFARLLRRPVPDTASASPRRPE